MPNYLLHLWSPPPTSLNFACPPAPAGIEGANARGFFDPATIDPGYSAIGYLSVALVIALVLLCYLWTATSTGPRFTRRWGLFLLLTGIVCFAATFLLRLWPTMTLADTCLAGQAPFRLPLPWSVILDRALAGFVWGLLVFVLLSLVLTRSLGRLPWSKGFFHNRGCPWPRLNPLAD